MAAIEEPVPTELGRSLRAEVLALRTAESRHRFPSRLCVGAPGRSCRDFVEPIEADDRARLDHGLRTEIMALMLDRSLERYPGSMVWLIRPGTLETRDTDVAWLAATIAASAELATDPAMVVMTRNGWRDPRSGASRVWRRLRPRS